MSMPEDHPGTNRREILRSAGLLGAGIAATASVAACSGTTSTPSAGAQASSAASTGSGTSVSVAGVPVGGGVVDAASKTVITRIADADWKAFDSTCTHQGCQVSDVADAKIHCACHQSYFDAASGEPVSGPAKAALATKSVSVSGDTATVS